MCELHELVHAYVLLGVEGDLEEVQHHLVHAHVAQQPLLVLTRLQGPHCGYKEGFVRIRGLQRDVVYRG